MVVRPGRDVADAQLGLDLRQILHVHQRGARLAAAQQSPACPPASVQWRGAKPELSLHANVPLAPADSPGLLRLYRAALPADVVP